ncbi:P-loop containing nucleoside triphosphate hydrolase [Apiospora phragmitis]|uniref:P-loop containing nucleoside triphosphate hydrolase n=1 Tax=Apiospora phragmitis TaxID=2905665 RepID=A0ABR1USF4_9PEZI
MPRPMWSADFVMGKGSGLTFLLHGKPGVGKTLTAECIAAFTKRPLMILTSSDIGTDAKDVEKNLTEHFRNAKSWGAVLLIDEADVFMERRSTADLTRNSLVAGFLRALEYYEGILFLTTNRVGSFDDAFISRVHVQLYYPEFTDHQRQKVWQTFIDKLERDRKGYMRLNMASKEYIEQINKSNLKWNGREIRNAFQTAVSLAEYDAEKDAEGTILVTDQHLRAVVELSKDFKDYLQELHSGDEDKRAQGRAERLDSFKADKN